MSFKSILEKHRSLAFSTVDKGTRFERLMKGFLQTDPVYADIFSRVWIWDEFPYRDQFGGHDVGIDIVGETREGEFWAVQCKCYQEDTVIAKNTVDSFLATSSKTFSTEEGEVKGFSTRLWISTSNKWGKNAEEALHNQKPPVLRITELALAESPVDWDKLDEGVFGDAARKERKELRPHQAEAVERAHEYFKTADRGKLIMACGTGKTFTALKIAERETEGRGLILVLVPSIALLGQTLKEWYADADLPINAICICSDAGVSKKKKQSPDSEEMRVIDLALPASTDVDTIMRQFQRAEMSGNGGMTVVFSTYQSIDVIASVQKRRGGSFDLIVCDEAHRTTGVTLAGAEESAFVSVHNNSFIAGKKRLYMTATPRIFSESSKVKADAHDAVLCSMDDERLYGEEIYRLGFGQAVDEGLLTDYKVLVLTLSDDAISPSVQKMVADADNSINADDASKLIGCVNALSKQIVGDEGMVWAADPQPMRRAVAFCSSIAASKEITGYFNEVAGKYVSDLPDEKQKEMVSVASKHIDGSMSAVDRDDKLSWLKEDSQECRILTNVRCLSEGVDVPSLDAVLFLSARNSQVDVVQSVGRVMRRAPNKRYGYIVIPVIVPSDMPPEKVLDDNERFKVVWTVLNALRAHDDRFNATINKIDLNKKKPKNILIGKVGTVFDGEGNAAEAGESQADMTIQTQLQLEFEELKGAIYAKMVMKVGDRDYWENWAREVAGIAEQQRERIARLVLQPGVSEKFALFVAGLRENINPSISEDEAVDMLSQHMITRPVFEALFANYSFASHNPVSLSMQEMIEVLEAHAFEKETESLSKFYESVRKRVAGIDNAEGRERVIVRLYETFFKTAFPKMVEQLGIVYTPVEVVDFMLRSVDEVLRREFGRGLTDESVHVLDPFTGTGTFVTRLLASGLIRPEDLQRKYQSEIHANEIVLLAYYIAAVNIENVYHGLRGEGTAYESFPGICLTDTFQLGEFKEGEHIASEFFPRNSDRVNVQRKTPITVIVGNPPYSAGQKSANDNAQNMSYPHLERRIEETYVVNSAATNKNSVYDSYIKAFRWASDRLERTHGGVICFVSNGGWLDGNAMDGFRKEIEAEFNRIYVFNLRGNARTSGELREKEKDNVFGQGTRTPVTITLLVKNPAEVSEKAEILYHDIGDYLSREEKLGIIKRFGSVEAIEWEILEPNAEGDWVNHRNPVFATYVPLGNKGSTEAEKAFFVPVYSNGLKTNRDSWCYNSSKEILTKKIQESIAYYNAQVDEYSKAKKTDPTLKAEEFIIYDSTKFSWARQQKRDIENLKKYSYQRISEREILYRPYSKQHGYFNKQLNDMVYQLPKLFPTPETENLVICMTGLGTKKEFSTLISDIIPDVQLIANGQCFPLYYYEDAPDTRVTITDAAQTSLFAVDEEEETYSRRKDGVSDFIFRTAKTQYQRDDITKEDIFYYVYGFLHSPAYRKTFSADLKKMLPRLPLVEHYTDFAAFSKAGRALADLHLHYENAPPCSAVVVTGAESGNFRVEKMRFPKKDQKDTIIYNSSITLSNIPAKAYEYIVNGKSAIEWIMERYQITVDKKSGIRNDPNDWAKEVGNPRYILDLLLSVITVSIRTMEIVEELPNITFGKEQ